MRAAIFTTTRSRFRSRVFERFFNLIRYYLVLGAPMSCLGKSLTFTFNYNNGKPRLYTNV